MPVLRISLQRLTKMVGAGRKTILDRLPYIGLDIESQDKEWIRVEYSPNRPDFGTDYGVARALRGLIGREVGLPHYSLSDSGLVVSVDRRLTSIRPFISCVGARGLRLDDEVVRQLIGLQEDLHNSLGRRRRRVAIGLHDMDAVKPPLYYKAVPNSFEFVPLDSKSSLSVADILSSTNEGKAYGSILSSSELYPVILDSVGAVLSLPPIINGNLTRVTTSTRSLLADVTGTDSETVDQVLCILATTLAEAGGRLGSVLIRYPTSRRRTPELTPKSMDFDLGLIRSVLGLQLTRKEAIRALGRSRLSAIGKRVLCPSYRVDLLHPVDIAEEVAIGYGVDRIGPVYPPSKQPGTLNRYEEFLDATATVMAESGMIEMLTYELTDGRSLYTNFSRPTTQRISVQSPKSAEHSLLRDALLPTLMASVSSNVKSDYPQRVFEVGRVYLRDGGSVRETFHLGCLVAHSQSNFTEAKMYLESACVTLTGKELTTKESQHWAFAPGRCAAVLMGGVELGHVGEVGPEVLASFGLNQPVSGFEVDLAVLHKSLK